MSALLSQLAESASHQELGRIVDELIGLYASQPSEWLPVAVIEGFLCQTLGYEDVDELEDALKGSFVEFLCKLPTCVVQRRGEGERALQFKIGDVERLAIEGGCALPKKNEGADRQVVTGPVTVASRNDLWRPIVQAVGGVVRVPELDFVIASTGTRRIDRLYIIVLEAVESLERHVAEHSGDRKILETTEALRQCLDLKRTWTVEVHGEGSEIGAPAQVELDGEGSMTEASHTCIAERHHVDTDALAAAVAGEISAPTGAAPAGKAPVSEEVPRPGFLDQALDLD